MWSFIPIQPSILSLYRSVGSGDTGAREPPHRTDTYNIVICGETGAGKSSLVNLIAKKNIAVMSADAWGCTTGTDAYEVLIQNGTLKVKMFDTAGLGEGPEGMIPDMNARRMLKELLQTRTKQRDIHLIMYCVRGERVIRSLRRDYLLIRSQVKKKVPIALVVTCLESYKPDMEEWWRVNKQDISNFGMTFAGHACITTAMSHTGRRAQSYDDVCKLIAQCRMAARKNIVLFGQAGAGRSSLVNLMAGENVAKTSSHMGFSTLHWQEYFIEFSGESYKVFETVGLQEPWMGIKEYLDAVENSYRLVQDLERQGGIDLLLFCMRAGRLTATLQSNYRLFYEFLCDKKVPIAVVITYLEKEDRDMDDWWERNKISFDNYGIHVTGHACVTAIEGGNPAWYQQSRTTIRKLVKESIADRREPGSDAGGSSLFLSFMHELKERHVGKERRNDMVSRLTENCGMSPNVAKKLADRISRRMTW